MGKQDIASCFKCKGNAIIELNYTSLCKKCFVETFEKRIRQANREFEMLNRNDVVVAGVSGGKDSACLLYALKQLQEKIGFQLHAVLIDEGIEGYRNECMKEAEKLCQALGMQLHVKSYKQEFHFSLDELLKERNKKNLQFKACTVCGVLRKTSLDRAAKELNATKLATGHNADDISQTFLMNLMRAETDRLASTLPKTKDNEFFIPRIKPLIYNTEKECAIYATIKELPFELRECPNSSESFRGGVKDFLNKMENGYPGIKFNVLNSYLKISKELDEKGLKKKGNLIKCIKCSGFSSKEECKACEILKTITE